VELSDAVTSHEFPFLKLSLILPEKSPENSLETNVTEDTVSHILSDNKVRNSSFSKRRDATKEREEEHRTKKKTLHKKKKNEEDCLEYHERIPKPQEKTKTNSEN
jgi:hypothetical protein